MFEDSFRQPFIQAVSLDVHVTSALIANIASTSMTVCSRVSLPCRCLQLSVFYQCALVKLGNLSTVMYECSRFSRCISSCRCDEGYHRRYASFYFTFAIRILAMCTIFVMRCFGLTRYKHLSFSQRFSFGVLILRSDQCWILRGI